MPERDTGPEIKLVERTLAEFADSSDGADGFMVGLFYEWVDGNIEEGQVSTDEKTGETVVQAPLREDRSIWMGLRWLPNRARPEPAANVSLFLNPGPVKTSQRPFYEYVISGRVDSEYIPHSRHATLYQEQIIQIVDDWPEHAHRDLAELDARFRTAAQSRAY